MHRDSLTRKLFKGGIILFVGLIIDLGISFIAKVFIARYLGRADYGAIALGSAFLSFASSFVLLGLNTGVARFLPRFDVATERAERKAVMVMGLLFTLPLTILLGGIVALYPGYIATRIFHAPDASEVIAVFAVGLPFVVGFKFALGVIQGYKWTVPKVILQNILKPVLRFSGIAFGIWLGLDAVGMSIYYILPFIIINIVSLYWLRQTALFDFSVEIRETDIEYCRIARDLLTFSVPLVITSVMLTILADIDRFLLSYYQSTADVGVYSVIYPLSRLLTIGLSGFSFIFMPILSELHAENNLSEMRRVYQIATKWIFFITLPIGAILVFFPKQVVRYTFGIEYVSGSTALVVLAVGFFFHAVVGLNGPALTSVGRTKSLSIINILTATINVVLNILLIPQYSYLGAAIATTIAYFAMTSIYTWLLFRTTGIQPFSRALTRPGLVSVIYFTLVYLSLTQMFSLTLSLFALHLVIAAIGYLTILIKFGAVQEEEVEIINSVEQRFDINLEKIKKAVRGLQ